MVIVDFIGLMLKVYYQGKELWGFLFFAYMGFRCFEVDILEGNRMRLVFFRNVLEMVSRFYDNDVKYLDRLCCKYLFGNINI